MVARTRRARHEASRKTSEEKEDPLKQAFGWCCTCDHVHMKDWWQRPGVGGYEHLLNCFDLGCDFRAAYPVPDQGFVATEIALKQFLGPSIDIRLMYCDRHKAVAKVCKENNISLRSSPPGDHMSNGVIENLNKRIQGGARAHLHCAGLPCCFWPCAAQHWCALCNFSPRGTLPSPYFRRHGVDFKGLLLPLGCGVYYYPAETRYTHLSKAEPRLCYGIFLGYDLDQGYVWNGLYCVADIDDFQNLSLDAHADPAAFKQLTMPHYTKIVRIEKNTLNFPLYNKYQLANETVLGREQYYGNALPTPDKLSALSWQMKHQCNMLIKKELAEWNPEYSEAQIRKQLHDLSKGPKTYDSFDDDLHPGLPRSPRGGWITLGLEEENEKSGTHTQTYNNSPDSEPQKVSPETDEAKADGPSKKSDQGWIEDMVNVLDKKRP